MMSWLNHLDTSSPYFWRAHALLLLAMIALVGGGVALLEFVL